ncbi:ATP-binding cassette domain-containing protein [Flavobacteriaceae bacterium]|nr:ATP-binding cassette domain-containing protein [Flavobacteriaceae bacterium]
MLKTDQLLFYYKKSEQSFSFPNIDLKAGKNLLVLGKSGIGKTTLLHLLAGLLKPVGGKVVIEGVDIHTLSHSKLDQFRGQHVGLVFQKKHAIPSLNVVENLEARLFFSKKHVNSAAIDYLLEQLEISDCKTNRLNTLSEGQLQRLGIAMAVVHNPKIILADEPTASLDDENCKKVIELLITQAKHTNANLIVITHDHRIKSLFSNSISL